MHQPTISVLLTGWLVVCVGATLAGQEPVAPLAEPPVPPEITIELEGEVRSRVRLAFPAAEVPAVLTADDRRMVAEVEATLRQDLMASGVFDVQGPEILSVLVLSGERNTDFELYRSLANEVLLESKLYVDADQEVVLEVRLFDLKSRGSILGKRYRGERQHARRVAHHCADELVYYVSGRPGIARTRLAFVSNRDDAEGNKELYLMDYDGYHQRRISGHRSLTLSPAWSASGDIAYVSYFRGRPGIYLVDMANEGAKRAVVSDEAHNYSPSFSPDGERIAFVRSLGGNSEIYVVERGGEGLRRLTHSPAIDASPAWSPDGRRIAFTSSRAGTPQIYVMDASGNDLQRFTFEGQYNDGATWHPAGNKLAYASRSGPRAPFHIALLDLISMEVRLLTSGPGSHEAPSFSPDGRRIAFELIRDGRTQIFVIDVDGTNLRQLTSAGDNFAPAWSNYEK